MSRAKAGTRMAHVHISNAVYDSAWITNHSIGLLDTVTVNNQPLLDEAGAALLDESGGILTDTVSDTDEEITTVSFVGDERPTPNSETGLFKAL